MTDKNLHQEFTDGYNVAVITLVAHEYLVTFTNVQGKVFTQVFSQYYYALQFVMNFLGTEIMPQLT